MNETKIIQEIIGTSLEEHGFTYDESSDLESYVKEKNNIIQKIMVFQHELSKYQIKLIFSTTAFGQEPREIYNIIPEFQQGYWIYNDEAEYRKILTYFRDVILSDGLEFLDTISIPTTELKTTDEIERYLYDHHEEIAMVSFL